MDIVTGRPLLVRYFDDVYTLFVHPTYPLLFRGRGSRLSRGIFSTHAPTIVVNS